MKRLLQLGVFITFLLTSSVTFGQLPEKIEVLRLETQKAITKLIKNIRVNHEGNKDLMLMVADLNDAATILYEKLEKEKPGGFITDSVFLYSLRSAQYAIERLSNTHSPDSISLVTVYLAKDYQTKISASGSTSISTTTTSIKVRVQVNKDGKLIEGYDVQCNYMWEAGLKRGKIRANELTNNASIRLSPGYYIFYILKNDKVVKTRDALVGSDYLDQPLIIHL